MAKKATIKKVKQPKISKFKLPKPVTKTFKVKTTAGKQTKEVKIGAKVYKSTTSTKGLTKKMNISNKGSITEPKSQRVSY